MELQTIRAAEVQELAQKFRLRAAEAEDTVYHALMLRTAIELEELAGNMSLNSGGEIVLIDTEQEPCPS